VTRESLWKPAELALMKMLTVQMTSNTENMFMGKTATTSFPKFGVRRGKAALVELANGLLGSLKSIEHDRQGLS
jgi:hypothetical protein